ncbi:MAG: hypothetical protein JWM33_411, partial [Caulobacteraceae bacterium]|nr:hypothetical protein [Caulobacteraceae bacterium]
MADPTLILAIGALAAGCGAAQLCGPLAADWRAKKGVLRRRLLALSTSRPGRGRRLAGAAVMVATLAGGAMTAYAAAPPAPRTGLPPATAPAAVNRE